jgi:hypothetical protein
MCMVLDGNTHQHHRHSEVDFWLCETEKPKDFQVLVVRGATRTGMRGMNVGFLDRESNKSNMATEDANNEVAQEGKR